MKFFSTFFLLLLFISAGVISAKRCSRAKRHKTGSRGLLGEYGPLILDFWCDGILVGWLGTKPLSADNEQFVRNELRALGISTDTMRIRRLGPAAIYAGCGPRNAMVVYLGQGWPQYLFIAEEWFNRLSVIEKRFLIAHEAAHLLYAHSQQRAYWALVATYVIIGTLFGVGKATTTIPYFVGHPWIALTCHICIPTLVAIADSAAVAAKNRHDEYQADEFALIWTNSFPGGLGVLTSLEEFMQSVEDELPQWRILKWHRKTIRSIFGTHPSCLNRKERLRMQADLLSIPLQDVESDHTINTDKLVQETCA